MGLGVDAIPLHSIPLLRCRSAFNLTSLITCYLDASLLSMSQAITATSTLISSVPSINDATLSPLSSSNMDVDKRPPLTNESRNDPTAPSREPSPSPSRIPNVAAAIATSDFSAPEPDPVLERPRHDGPQEGAGQGRQSPALRGKAFGL